MSLRSRLQAIRTRVFLLQLVIVAGLIVAYRAYAPRLEKSKAAAEAAEREKRIGDFIRAEVEEDTGRSVAGGASATSIHPQKLRRTLSLREVEAALGAPDERTSDFRGGLHLTWIAATHDLEASFDKGELYCLRIRDRHTGHGTMVFQSSLYWHTF